MKPRVELLGFFAAGDEIDDWQDHTHDQNCQEVELLELPDVGQEEQTQHTQRNKLSGGRHSMWWDECTDVYDRQL